MKGSVRLGIALLATASLVAAPALAADPSLQEVYRAADAGRLKQAEAMMEQVLRDHPNSGKAHYVEAELQAKAGRLQMARLELATAERLAPGLPFAKPASVDALNRQLNATERATVAALPPAAAAPAQSVPWGLVLVGIALLVTAIFFIRSLNRPRIAYGGGLPYAPGGGYAGPVGPGGYPQAYPAAYPQAYGAGAYPQPYAGGGMGSGIMGGLATGAAVGAGMVAGEALMHRVFDGGSHGVETPPAPVDYPLAPEAGYDLGGNDFGVSDGGSWDDASVGGGSDDWS